MDLGSATFPAEIVNLIFEFAGFQCREMASISCKALSGGALWSMVTRLEPPAEDQAIFEKWKDVEGRRKLVSSIITQIPLDGSSLRVLDIGTSGIVMDDIFGLLFKTLKHQLAAADLPPLSDEQVESFLDLSPSRELQDDLSSPEVHPPPVKSTQPKSFGSLRHLKLVVRLPCSDLLSRLSDGVLPNLRVFHLISLSQSSENNFWGANGSLAKFTNSHKLLRHLNLASVRHNISFQGFESAGNDLASMKQACKSALDQLGIPLCNVVLQEKTALNHLLGKNPSIERWINGFSALYNIEESRHVSRDLALQQCDEFGYKSLPKHLRNHSLIFEFSIQQRNRLRRLCPKILKSKPYRNRHSYFELCFALCFMPHASQSPETEDPWSFCWELLRYDPHNVQYIEGGLRRYPPVAERFAQEPLERLELIMTPFSAEILLEIVCAARKLTRPFLELVVKCCGSISSESTLRILLSYLYQEDIEWLPEDIYAINQLVFTSEELQQAPARTELGDTEQRNLASLPLPLQSNIASKFGLAVNPRKLVSGEAAAKFRGNRELIGQLRDYTKVFCDSSFVKISHESLSPGRVQLDLWIDIIDAATTPQQLVDWADCLHRVFGSLPIKIANFIGGVKDIPENRTGNISAALPNADAILRSWCKDKNIAFPVPEEHVVNDSSKNLNCAVM